MHFFIFFRLIGDEVCLACFFFEFFIMIYEKKEQAGGESGGEKEQAKSKIDKIEKILGGKDSVCLSKMCSRSREWVVAFNENG